MGLFWCGWITPGAWGGGGVVWQLTSSWYTLVTALPANKSPYTLPFSPSRFQVTAFLFSPSRLTVNLAIQITTLPDSRCFSSSPSRLHSSPTDISFWPPMSHQHCLIGSSSHSSMNQLIHLCSIKSICLVKFVTCQNLLVQVIKT